MGAGAFGWWKAAGLGSALRADTLTLGFVLETGQERPRLQMRLSRTDLKL